MSILRTLLDRTKAQQSQPTKPNAEIAQSSGVRRLLFLGTFEDVDYLPFLKGVMNRFQGVEIVSMDVRPANTITEVALLCRDKNITGVISTQLGILKKLSGRDKVSLDNFAGSFFRAQNLEFVFIHPLKQLVTVNYGPFITERYISKVAAPERWPEATEFSWRVLNPSNVGDFYARACSEKCLAIGVDTETIKSPLAIRECGYTLLLAEGDTVTTETVIIDLANCEPDEVEFMFEWMRKLNWNTKAPKVLQNGKYDCAYFARFGIPLYNYSYDTKNFFHCFLCELPKDLAFINAYYVRESVYWKDLGESEDLYTRHEYNCRDTWATINVWLQQMLTLPQYAFDNYILEFPVIFPCHLAEMTGIKKDEERRAKAYAEIEAKIEAATKRLEIITDTPGINVNSTPQMAALRKVLGCEDIKSSDEIHLKKIASRHPLNRRIVDLILDIRGLRKVNSTYLVEGKDFNGRYLYALNPDNTDTGRLASKEHHFWCGLNIQNQPQGIVVKQIYVADDDFLFGESDLKQAESRDTGYISGDEALIAAVESDQDFHSRNASAFFGLPYESIFDDATGKTINKPIRNLSKRTNHGATYNMGPDVMVDTMGLDNVWEARRLLQLPILYSARQVTKYLLERFHHTYPKISGTMYTGIIAEVKSTGYLVSKVKNFRAWTRRCFGKPDKNKLDLNSLVAHPPQSLNAMTLNRGWVSVYIKVWRPNKKNFKMNAQIHDSILFQFRKGYRHLADQVKECMEIPTTIEGYDGKVRTFTVPADLKLGKSNEGARYWSETE